MGRCRNRARIHTLAMAAHLPTIYNAREFVEAGGVMSYGPNASDSVPALRRGREGGGQQAVSSLNESTLVPCAKCVQQNSAHSRESGNPGQGRGSLKGGPGDGNGGGCPSGGGGEGVVFCRYHGTKIPIHPLYFIRPPDPPRASPRAPDHRALVTKPGALIEPPRR